MNDENNPYAGIIESMELADDPPSPVEANPYDEVVVDMDEARREREAAQLRANIEIAKQQNPDLVANINKAVQSVGLPRASTPFLDDRFVQRVEGDALLQEIMDAPVTRELLGDRSFAAWAHDEVGSLTKLERTMMAFGTLEPGQDRAFDPAAVRGAKNLGDSLLLSGTGLSKGLVGTFLSGAEALGIDSAINSYRWWIDTINRTEQGIRGRQAFGSRFEQQANQGIESVVPTVAGVALAAGGAPQVGIPLIGAQTYGLSYIQARDAGLSIGRAAVFAGQQAGVEMLTEKLPFDTLLRNLRAGSPVLETLGRQLLAEVPGEQIATAWQDANEWLYLHPTKSFGDYLAERPSAAADTLVATVVGTLATGGGSIAVNMGIQQLEAWRAERKIEKLKGVFEEARNTKLRERDPEGFAQALQKMADRAGTPEVYIEAQALAQIIDKAGEGATAIAPALSTTLADLPEAIAAGGDVRIPVGALVSAVTGTSIEQDILDNIRVSPDAMSAAQAAQVRETNVMAELEKQAQTVFELQQNSDAFMRSADVVYQNVLGQLNQTKRFNEQVNTSYAELVKNFYAVQADKLGVTPEELFQRFPLQIAGAIEQGAQGMDQRDPDQLTPAELAFFDPVTLEDFQHEAPSFKIENGRASIAYEDLEKLSRMIDDFFGGVRRQGFRVPPSFNSGKFMRRMLRIAHGGGQAVTSTDGGDATAVSFEIAPDPGNTELTTRWDALPAQAKWEISRTVAAAVTPAIFEAIGVSGSLREQIGGWMGATNPSLAVAIVNPEQGVEVAKALGFVFAQEGAYVTSETAAEGLTQSGAVTIELPEGFTDQQVAELYDKLWGLERDGQKLVTGHTTANGQMVIMFPGASEAETDSIRELIFEHLGREFSVTSDTLFAAYVETRSNEDGDVRASEGPAAGQPSAQRDDSALGRLRKAATDQLAAAIASAGEPGAPRGYQQAGDGSGRDQSRGSAPLEGAPDVAGAAGPDPRLVAVAERYASENGIPARRQAEYVEVDVERAQRIAAAYEAMPHAPGDPAVRAAYADLIRQTMAQYRALEAAGYRFWFYDETNDPYEGNAWNAMRDLRANQRMGVFATEAGFGSGATDLNVEDNPLLADTGLTWPYGAPDGPPKRVLANDLFRAVHDAFGHGLEGAGFRARGEENAWQAHVRLFTGPAIGAMTSETRGQNSWLNFGPYGEQNRTARVEDTVFADQKTGLMPEWTWSEGIARDEPQRQTNEGLAQSASSPRGFYTPSARRISLLETANLSTFLHETGHFFLDVYEDLAARDGADPGIAQDMQILLDWFGVKDLATWRKMSLNEKRPYHEKFAEGFERYLFKGEAPSVDMQGMFNKFRAWLIAVYKTLRQTFSPQVREVVDRMIATDMQIAQAEAVRNMAPIFETAEQAGMTTEEFAEYHELAQRATDAAKADLQKRSLADMKWLTEAKAKALREATRDARLKRAEVEAEVRDEVMRMPIYAAMRFMSHGELPPGFAPEGKAARRAEQVTALEGSKISLDIVRELYGDGAPSLSTGKYGLATKKGGLHPQVIADLFGFRSVDELMQAIIQAEPVADLVEGMTDQRMLERYGDIASPEALERAAEAAIHNEARARFIAAELNALQRANDAKTQTGVDRNGRRVSANTLVLAAKKLAGQIIGRTLIKDLSPSQYAAAEARNAKQTFEAMATGDIAKAAAAKRQQLISHRTTAEALRAQTEVQRGLRYLSKFTKEKVRDGIDPEYVEQIFNLLERYDLRKSTTQRQMQRRQSLADWYDAQMAAGQQPVISEALVKDARKISYKQLTVDEFREIIDAVKNIEHLGRLKQRLLTNKDGRAWDAIKAEITASLQDNRTTDRRTYSEDGWRAAASDLWNGFLAMHRKLASLVYEMDGFKYGGVLWTYLVKPMNERGAMEASMREKATIELSRILKPLLRKGGLGGRRTYYAEVGQSLTREQLLTVALNRGNEGNLQRLMDGGIKASGPVRIEQIDALLAHLTAEEWSVVQKIWDYFESYRPLIAEKERRVTGVEPEWIEPVPFSTPHGNMRGGYFPIKYDPKASKKAEQHADAEAARAQMQAAFTSSTTRRSFTKSRAETVTGRPLLLNFGGIYQGLNEVIHDLAWHEWLIDANRILRDESIDRDMRQGWGPEGVRTLTTAVQDIARGDVGAQNEFERIINHLRTGATVAGLGWNLMTSLLQPLGLTQTAVRIGTPWMLRGMTRWMSDPVGAVEEIHGKSELMRLRGKTMQREINEVANAVKGQSAGGALFQSSLFYLIQKFQALADVPTWLGAYEKAIAGNETEERAVALADQAVLDAQGGGQQKDLAAIQRGGPLLKLFTNFYSFFNTTWNLATERTKATLAKPSPQAVASLAVDYALLFSVPAIAGELMRVLLNMAIGGEPPDEEEIAQKLAAAHVSYLLGTLVGLREVGGIFSGVTGYSGPAGNRFFASLTDLGKQISQGEIDRPLTRKAVDVIGILAHLPSGQINRSIDGAMALIEGDTVNPAAILLGKPR